MSRNALLYDALAIGAILSVAWVSVVSGQSSPPSSQPCVILKRMGPADEVTSHLYSFGIRGKQFQYQAGKLPESVKFHGRLTDHDVRAIQNAGGRVEIINDHYTDQELATARKSCNLSGSDAPTPPTSNAVSASAPKGIAAVSVKSTPDGADITIDGKFSGSTPSKLQLTEGSHTILVEQTGYAAWKRTIAVSPGNDISLTATLAKEPTAQ